MIVIIKNIGLKKNLLSKTHAIVPINLHFKTA